MEILEDIQVTKIVDRVDDSTKSHRDFTKILGVHQEKNVYLYTGKFGEYLKHDGYNYSIQDWAKKENLKEMFNLSHAINIIDWKNNRKVDTTETRKTINYKLNPTVYKTACDLFNDSIHSP